jgi:hypothetical protein
VAPFRPSFCPPLYSHSRIESRISPLSTAFLPRAQSRGTTISPITPLSTGFTYSHSGMGRTAAPEPLLHTLAQPRRIHPFVFSSLRIAHFPSPAFSQTSALPYSFFPHAQFSPTGSLPQTSRSISRVLDPSIFWKGRGLQPASGARDNKAHPLVGDLFLKKSTQNRLTRPSSSEISPLDVAFTPIRALIHLSTAFTQNTRGWVSPRIIQYTNCGTETVCSSREAIFCAAARTSRA